MNSDLQASYSACRELAGGAPDGIGVGISLLPNEQRDHAAALYALYRTLQGLVDESDAGRISAEQAREGLSFWRTWFEGGCWEELDDPLAPAGRYTILANDVPAEIFLELIEALEVDLARTRYQSTQEVIRHCAKRGSCLAVAMCYVFGVEDPVAHARATELAVAIQLTNVIRDVGDDVSRDRVRLPLMEMGRHRVSEAHLKAHVLTRGYRKLMEELSGVAEAYYDAGLAELSHIPSEGRRAVRVGAAVHREVLAAVRRNGYDNFTRRAAASPPRNALMLMRDLRQKAHRTARAIPEGLPDGAALLGAAVRPNLTLLTDAS